MRWILWDNKITWALKLLTAVFPDKDWFLPQHKVHERLVPSSSICGGSWNLRLLYEMSACIFTQWSVPVLKLLFFTPSFMCTSSWLCLLIWTLLNKNQMLLRGKWNEEKLNERQGGGNWSGRKTRAGSDIAFHCCFQLLFPRFKR